MDVCFKHLTLASATAWSSLPVARPPSTAWLCSAAASTPPRPAEPRHPAPVPVTARWSIPVRSPSVARPPPDAEIPGPAEHTEAGTPVTGERFFVQVAGKTNGAHLEYVEKLRGIGQTEVFSPDQSDYVMVFCPIASRVGTDVGEALADIPDGKPTILVVMHHNYDPYHVVGESRRQVNDPNVLLTVDCLFHEGKFLSCNRNDDAWHGIQRALGVSAVQVSMWNALRKWLDHPLAVVVMAVIIIVLEVTKKQDL